MKLHPCPFCGSDEVDFFEDQWGHRGVECTYCSANLSGFKNDVQALKAWNERHEVSK